MQAKTEAAPRSDTVLCLRLPNSKAFYRPVSDSLATGRNKQTALSSFLTSIPPPPDTHTHGDLYTHSSESGWQNSS